MTHIHLAGCILQDDQGRVLLLHRNTAKRTQWEIPGGKIDEGENAQKAAVREVKEELGVDVVVHRQLGSKSFEEDGYTMQYTWFSATVTGGSFKIMEPQTHDAFRFFDMQTLDELAALSPNAANFFEELRAQRIVL